MGKKKRLLKKSWDFQETKGEMKGKKALGHTFSYLSKANLEDSCLMWKGQGQGYQVHRVRPRRAAMHSNTPRTHLGLIRVHTRQIGGPGAHTGSCHLYGVGWLSDEFTKNRDTGVNVIALSKSNSALTLNEWHLMDEVPMLTH
eukprot:Gb_11375 [translate_table: standard]